MSRALPLLALAAVLGCGSPPVAPATTRLDVLHQVYLRGQPGRGVGLSFDGLGPCAADLLGRLKEPAEGQAALRATFFLTADEVAEGGPVLGRLVAEGHEVALRVPAPPAAWRAGPEAMRQGLTAAARALDDALADARVATTVPRFWRPGGAPDPLGLGGAAEVERPVVLWSVYGEGGTPAELAASLVPRLADGEIVALPVSRPGCPAVGLVPALAEALAARKLAAVPVSVVLGEQVARHHPPQLVRYLGPGLPAACAAPLGVEAGAVGDRPRWGLVEAETAAGVRVLPLGGSEQGTAEVLAGPALDLWAKRAAWLAMPGCARTIAADHILPPVTPLGPGGRVQWWVVEELGTSQRDARVAGPPGGTTSLPATPDLVRIEARQRLPWVLRGLVAGALARLGLETPLLLEGRASVALVIGRPLAPGATPAEVEAGIGGFVQVVELSLAEYLYLAVRSPVDLPALLRTARASDGFLRPGPFLVLRRGGLPTGDRLGPDGEGFPVAPGTLVQRVLATGASLGPGDVVAAAAPPLLGAPEGAEPPPDRLSRRARLRHGLARSILSGAGRSGYLRPGAVLRVDGDLLGRQLVRVVSPAGVAVPSGDAIPIRPVAPWGEP